MKTRRFLIKLKQFFKRKSQAVKSFEYMINSNKNENGKDETN